MRIDVHQHLLSQPLLAALERRGAVPFLERSAHGWTYHLAGEPDSALPQADADVAARVHQLDGDGVDRALVLLSAALGIEHLPVEEAAPLLSAYHDGAAALPADRFGAWAAAGVREPDPDGAAALLARGFAGLSLPATALATPTAVERLGPLLEAVQEADAPLFVHPGPVALDGSDAAAAGAPAWWPAMTGYVAQMNAAWHAFLAAGRPALPRLRVVFAMLAGLAPLQLERLAARGGPARQAHDPLFFYDTSSYGPRAVDATIRVVGADQLVHGSDRPVVGAPAPAADTALGHALTRINPARLLGRVEPPTPATRAPA